MSSSVGAHHSCFTHIDGLASQATAPSNPPTIEIVAAGFFRLTHEQTVSLLKTITATATAISRMNAIQRAFVSMVQERRKTEFLRREMDVYNQARAAPISFSTYESWVFPLCLIL